MFKKLLISLLLVLTIFFSFAPYLSPTKAQAWYSQNPTEWYLKVYDPSISPPSEIFGERYTAAQVQWVIFSTLSLPIRVFIVPAVGEDTVNFLLKWIGTGTIDIDNFKNAVGDIITKFGGAVFPISDSNQGKPFLALVFDTGGRDISGIGYTKNLLNKFSLVSEVKAQGVGYQGLTWIQTYWKGFRDISYALLVLVVIVFAFMIMFRVKLSPQTVISVQSALPKVIVAMVLITFSYAIAGFAIDLMYVVSGLFAMLLKYAGFSENLNGAFAFISGTGAGFNILGGFWVLFMMLAYFIMFFICAVWTILASIISGLNLFGAVLGIILLLISVWVLVLGIWYAFKVPYVLIKTLISVYLSIITAPIQILAGAISPSMGFGIWFRRLMSDILVFPVVGLVFWFAWDFLWSAYAAAWGDVSRYWSNHVFTFFGATPGATPDAWIPGIIGSKGIGADSGITGILLLAMSFGMIVLVPKVPELLKGILMGEKFSFGTAMGEAMGPAQAVWGRTAGYRQYAGDQTASKIFKSIEKTISTSPKLAKYVPKTAQGYISGRAGSKADFERKY